MEEARVCIARDLARGEGKGREITGLSQGAVSGRNGGLRGPSTTGRSCRSTLLESRAASSGRVTVTTATSEVSPVAGQIKGARKGGAVSSYRGALESG